MLDPRRLITGGCSCTQHCWPTWADYLGKHYADFQNVGLSGADNAVIARNVMQVAQPGDLVVVAWTGFDRFNSFKIDRKQENKTLGDRLVIEWSGLDSLDRGGWHHSGSLQCTKNFLVNYYHRVERFKHSLDYIKMLEMHSQITGYELWNFSWVEWLLGEFESEIDDRLVRMLANTNINHLYRGKDLWTVRNEVAPLTLHHKYGPDTHPTPWANWIWLRDHVAPEIGITLDMVWEDQVKLDQQRVLIGDVD